MGGVLQEQNQLYSDTTEFHLCLFALFLLVWLFPWLTDKIFAVTERRTWNLRRPAQVTFAPTKLPATSDAAKARSSCVSAQLIISLQKYRLFLQLRKLRLKRARLWQQTHTGNHWRALCRDKRRVVAVIANHNRSSVDALWKMCHRVLGVDFQRKIVTCTKRTGTLYWLIDSWHLIPSQPYK